MTQSLSERLGIDYPIFAFTHCRDVVVAVSKAGGMALGAAGVWTGKPCRMLRNEWTEAWDRPDTPDPLGMPLQGLVTSDGIRRTAVYASHGDCPKVAFNPCGQVIGQINQVESVRQVMFRLLDEYVEAVGRAGSLLPEI